MQIHRTIVAGATLLIAPAALAQTTPAPAPTTAPTTTPAPAAPAASATSTTYTDAELTQFARAALAVEKVRKDATIAEADKNARMVAAISGVGIDPERFNAIGQAMQSDPALNQRIQKAAAAQLPASAAPATPK
jgi:hypothetical protein